MKINFSAHSIAIASFGAITITSWSGLAILPKTAKGKLTSSQWVLVITGSFSLIGRCCLGKKRFDDSQASTSNDLHVHTHGVLDSSFDDCITKEVEKIVQEMSTPDEVLARQTRANTEITLFDEQEQQAKNNMLTMLSDLGTNSDPLDALQGAVRICSDTRLWIEPANYETRYSDTERFYSEEKIFPVTRYGQITWNLRFNYDPHEEVRWSAENVEQTPFRPFCCCSRCKYIGEYHRSCAVVPFGCGTGDRSDDCREFEAKDNGNQGIEIDRPESEIVRVTMEALSSSSLWQE